MVANPRPPAEPKRYLNVWNEILLTWTCPAIGSFKYEGMCWSRTVKLPDFKVFRYRFGRRNAGTSKVPMHFKTEDEHTIPSKLAITIAERVIKNQQSLVPKLLKALHDDLHGKGPRSFIWWHGDIDSVYEDLSYEKPPLKNLKLDKPDKLVQLLGSPRVVVCEFGYGYSKPLATICFEALFEIEHGVGILTDGRRIVGTGYEMDASPFSRR